MQLPDSTYARRARTEIETLTSGLVFGPSRSGVCMALQCGIPAPLMMRRYPRYYRIYDPSFTATYGNRVQGQVGEAGVRFRISASGWHCLMAIMC